MVTSPYQKTVTIRDTNTAALQKTVSETFQT